MHEIVHTAWGISMPYGLGVCEIFVIYVISKISSYASDHSTKSKGNVLASVPSFSLL